MSNRVCRTCLEVIDYGGQLFRLDTDEVMKSKLENCVPEIVLGRVKDPVICSLCFNSLNAAYTFRIRCQRTEAKIYDCITRLQTPCIDLNVFVPQETITENNSTPNPSTLDHNVPDYSIKEGPITASDNPVEQGTITDHNSILCKVCKKCFVSNELLKEHTMSHFSPVFKCNVCEFQTQSGPHLDEHLQLHNATIHAPVVQQFYQQRPEFYQCTNCAFNTPDVNLFKEHRTVHSTERLYHCSICSFSSPHQSSIKRHAKVHEKPFKCTECKYQTLDKSDLTAHMNLHLGQQFKCNYCPYFNLKRCNLRRHRLRNHPDKVLANEQTEVPPDQPENPDPYKVSITEIESILLDEDELPQSVDNPTGDEDSFDVTVDDIQQILQNGNHHENGANVKPANTQPTVFKCPTCSETFKYKYLLRKHVSIHSTDKPFECPECGLHTKTRVHLQGHMKTHGSGILYTCDKCDFSSIYWGILQKHNMVHTGEKPFKCPLCTYRGTYQSTVKYHLSTMHSKPYNCTECTFVTDNESELFNHMEVHSSHNRIEDSESQHRIHDSEILYNYISQSN